MYRRNVKNKRICLMGASGSGKDFVVSKIIEKYPEFIRLSFSDTLKEITHNIFPWMKKDYSPQEKEKALNLETSLGEKIQLSPRDIWLKMNFLRNIEDKLFVRKLDEELSSLEQQGLEHFIISDLRTPPELEYVLSKGFTLIRISNPNNFHKENDFDKQQQFFVGSVVKTYLNEIGKDFDENEFWLNENKDTENKE